MSIISKNRRGGVETYSFAIAGLMTFGVAASFADTTNSIGTIEHAATQWGRIQYEKRSGMSGTAWMAIPLKDYTFKGEGDIANLDGQNTTWQTNNQSYAQLRFDGWFQVAADKAGTWSFNQKYDDYFAIFIDGTKVLHNNGYKSFATGTADVTEGWHRFTIIAGDTYGGFGSNNNFGEGLGNIPFTISVDGGAAMAFNAANFPQGSGLNIVTLDADADWTSYDKILLNNGTVLDLNGHNLTVNDIICDDYVGSFVTNSAEKVSTVLFTGEPLESEAVANGLIKGVNTSIILATDGDQLVVWTGAANDGGNALNANNWQDVLTGDPIVPTSAHDVSVVGTAVNLQIPSGTAFACKSLDIGNCTFTANCDWTGLSVTPTISGAANLAGHVLTLNHLTAFTGASFSGADGSTVAFEIHDGTYTAFGEATAIDNISLLAFASTVKILLRKSDGGTFTSNLMKLGDTKYAEFVQTEGTVSLTSSATGIGSYASGNGGHGVYRISGGTITTGSSTEFIIGDYGRGELIQTGGSITPGNWTSIGRRTGGDGTYTMTGGTFSSSSARQLWIAGDDGSKGVWNVGGNAVAELETIYLGGSTKNANTVAELHVSGNAVITVRNTFRACQPESGNTTFTMTQSGGSISIAKEANFGVSGGSGSFVQSGGTFTTGTAIYIGDRGIATLDIGGTVTCGGDGAHLGQHTGTGTLIVRKGGTLNTPEIARVSGKGYAVFDGGRIVAKNTNAGFVKNVDDLLFTTNGVTIDSAGYNLVVTNTWFAEAAGSEIVKTGAGRLAFEKLPHVDSVVVSNGTLAVGTDCDNAASASLAHRWSFGGDLADSVTGRSGTLYGSGATYEDGAVKLPGGAKGTCWIDLGVNNLPSDGITVELWMTLREIRNWPRAMVIGGAKGIVFTPRRSTYGNTCNFDSCGETQLAGTVLAANKPYYVAISFMPDGNGGVTVRQYLKEAAAEEFLWTNRYEKVDYSVLGNVDRSSFWLGHGTDNSNDIKADYDEVRVWRGALSPEAIALSTAKGPDATAGDIAAIIAKSDETITLGRTIDIASGATLDLGGNTLTQPVVKGSGTIATGAGGSLVVSDKIVVNVGECIEASGTINLSNAKIELADPENLAETFTFLKPAAGQTLTVTGVPTPTNLPKGWKVSVSPSGVCRIGKSGFILIVK